MILQVGSSKSFLVEGLSANNIPLQGETPDLQTISAVYGDKEQAIVLTSLAREVFGVTGWQVATQRDSFGCKEGWNHTSPVFEGQLWEHTPWTRTDKPGQMAAFRRAALAEQRRDIARVVSLSAISACFFFCFFFLLIKS